MAPKARAQMIEETRNKLLEAGRQAFGSVGYAQTSMDELTASAGLTRGALYHHFGDKKGCCRRLCSRSTPSWTRNWRRCLSRQPVRGKASGGAAGCFWKWPRTSRCNALCCAMRPRCWVPNTCRAASRRAVRRWRPCLRDLMDTHVIQDTDPEALARLIQGGLMDASFWIAADHQPPQRLTAALDSLDLMLRGVLRAPQP
jgi:AcrR family transcriptional regulator